MNAASCAARCVAVSIRCWDDPQAAADASQAAMRLKTPAIPVNHRVSHSTAAAPQLSGPVAKTIVAAGKFDDFWRLLGPAKPANGL